MKRLVAIFLLLIVACAVALLFLSAEHDSVTLAELALIDEKNSASANAKVNFVETVGADDVFPGGLGIDSIFYAVLSVCGVVIAIRAVVSIVRALKEERLRAVQRADEPHGDVSQPARASIESSAAFALFSTGVAPDSNDRVVEKQWVSQLRPSVSRSAPSRVLDYLGRCTTVSRVGWF